MSRRTWFADQQFTRYFNRQQRGSRRSTRRKQAFRSRLTTEALEDRVLLSAVMVVNASDSGAGSLRAAITQVNADTQPGVDTIKFAIGSGVQTITPLSALPMITHSVVIDGTSQPGFTGTPLIVLEGNRDSANGLEIAAGNSAVKGLVIDDFIRDGILLDTNGGDTIAGNYLGMGVTGAQPKQTNGIAGVQIIGTTNNTIGGTAAADRNVIDGVIIGTVSESGGATDAASFNLVEGNYIGTDVTGTKGGWRGVEIYGASNNTIGGTTSAAGNLTGGVSISGNGNFNLIEGDYIGTDVTGTKALGGGGVQILGGGGFDTIGGTSAGARNLISGTTAPAAILISLSHSDVVEGNYVGTDVTGTLPLPNVGINAILVHAATATIGGTTAGAGNIIAFNAGTGVVAYFTGGAILENSIFGNGTRLAARGTMGGIRDISATKAIPVLTSALSYNGSLTVVGTLTSMASSSNRLEFFSNPAGTSQGETYLGFITVITDATGKGTFTATFTAAVASGQVITATATDPTNSTSAFSNGLVVIAGSAPQALAARSLVSSMSLAPTSSISSSVAQAAAPTTMSPALPTVSVEKPGTPLPRTTPRPPAVPSSHAALDRAFADFALDSTDAESWYALAPGLN